MILLERDYSSFAGCLYYSYSRQMKVDTKENENEYIIDAELPGINREAVNIELNDNTLTISV